MKLKIMANCAKRCFLLATFLLSAFNSFPQKEITNQSLYWTRYFNQLALSPKLTWHNEIENRRFFENNRQHHFIIHSRLHYKTFKRADFAAGFSYGRQSPHTADSEFRLSVPELRPYQEVSLTNTYGRRLSVQQRLRMDERFIKNNNGTELLDGYQFNLRFRYRLQASVILSKTGAEKLTALKIADELMINAGDGIVYNQFDQNRVYLGIEQGVVKGLAVELGYLNWYQQRPSGKQFFARDIVRITLHHKINLYKQL
ncbi:DUF2490 domain-containing protein [Paradesertivirga mongoliensis]|uniref:DUF2490 domain-containing protein n=1 Tax=Paradesertivirga mongoliensis TaxID=2100740 RepID=A0ABW4ZPY2_9SPHI|nr:DUF2490 domain-containing protein [Pedobacter mongoliensis]